MNITMSKGNQDLYLSFSNTIRLDYVDKKIIRECSDSTVLLYLENKYHITFPLTAKERVRERGSLLATIREIRDELNKQKE